MYRTFYVTYVMSHYKKSLYIRLLLSRLYKLIFFQQYKLKYIYIVKVSFRSVLANILLSYIRLALIFVVNRLALITVETSYIYLANWIKACDYNLQNNLLIYVCLYMYVTFVVEQNQGVYEFVPSRDSSLPLPQLYHVNIYIGC